MEDKIIDVEATTTEVVVSKKSKLIAIGAMVGAAVLGTVLLAKRGRNSEEDEITTEWHSDAFTDNE